MKTAAKELRDGEANHTGIWKGDFLPWLEVREGTSPPDSSGGGEHISSSGCSRVPRQGHPGALSLADWVPQLGAMCRAAAPKPWAVLRGEFPARLTGLATAQLLCPLRWQGPAVQPGKSGLTGEHRSSRIGTWQGSHGWFGVLGLALFWFLKHCVSHNVFCTFLFCAIFHPRDLRALYSHYSLGPKTTLEVIKYLLLYRCMSWNSVWDTGPCLH